jgi:TonB family protein
MKLIILLAIAGFAVPAMAALPIEQRFETALDGLKDSNTARVGWAEVPSIWQSHFGTKRQRWHNSMRVEYSISRSGRIIACDVTESSGSIAFDNAACGALARVREIPVARGADGKAVRISGKVDYQLFYGPAWICATGLDEEE